MQKTSEDHTREQREREVLNTLATMPERSSATVLGARVERYLYGFFVDGGPITNGGHAAHLIVATADKDFSDSGEGPFDDRQQAVDFAAAEVGVEWKIVQNGSKFHVFVRRQQ